MLGKSFRQKGCKEILDIHCTRAVKKEVQRISKDSTKPLQCKECIHFAVNRGETKCSTDGKSGVFLPVLLDSVRYM